MLLPKFFEIEVQHWNQRAKYTPKKPDAKTAQQGRQRHLYVKIGGLYLTKECKLISDLLSGEGAISSFGSIATGLAAAHLLIDAQIGYRVRKYREDAAAAAEWDRSYVAYAEGRLKSALKEVEGWKHRIANYETSNYCNESTTARYDEGLTKATYYAEACRRHFVNAVLFIERPLKT